MESSEQKLEVLVRAEDINEGDIICYPQKEMWCVEKIMDKSISYVRFKLCKIVNGEKQKTFVDHDYGRASKLNVIKN